MRLPKIVIAALTAVLTACGGATDTPLPSVAVGDTGLAGELPPPGTSVVLDETGVTQGYRPGAAKAGQPTYTFRTTLSDSVEDYIVLESILSWPSSDDRLSLEVIRPDGSSTGRINEFDTSEQRAVTLNPQAGVYTLIVREENTQAGTSFFLKSKVSRPRIDEGGTSPDLCAEEGEAVTLHTWSHTAPPGTAGEAAAVDPALAEVREPFTVPNCLYDELEVEITWDRPEEDLDLGVENASGTEVGSSGDFNANASVPGVIEGTGEARETATIPLPAPGDYVGVTKSYANVQTAVEGTAVARCTRTGGCYSVPEGVPLPEEAYAKDTRVVVGVIDSAINPYHEFYYGKGPQWRGDKPTEVTDAVLRELGVKPENVVELTRTGNFAADREADAAFWNRVKKGELYHFKGTNIVAVSFAGEAEDGTPHRPLFPTAAKSEHGVGTSSAVLKANPDAIILFAETDGDLANAQSHNLVFGHPAVDIISTSYGVSLALGLLPIPETAPFDGSYDAVVRNGKMHFSSSGNGPGLSNGRAGAGPWWSIGVSGIEEESGDGRTATSGRFPDFVSDFTQVLPYCMECETAIDLTVPGTSFSTPRAAGIASKVLLEARRKLNHEGGIRRVGGEPVMAARSGSHVTTWTLRRSLEQAAWVPEFDPEQLPANAQTQATPINPAAPWLDFGWGDLTADPTKGVIEAALSHLDLALRPRTKAPEFCDFQTAIMRERIEYWNNLAPQDDLPDPLPIVFCDSQAFGDGNDNGGNFDAAGDSDQDGVANGDDNCPETFNIDQADANGDGYGDACQPTNERDFDADGVPDSADNCPLDRNPDQADSNSDGLGDACEFATQPASLCELPTGTHTLTSWTGTVGPLGTDEFEFELPPNCFSPALTVTIEWLLFAEDLDLRVDTPLEGEQSSANFQTNLAGRESVYVASPAAGTFRVIAEGFANANTDYTGTVTIEILSYPMRDADGDGVHDRHDQCPGTPSGQTASPDGCSVSQTGHASCTNGENLGGGRSYQVLLPTHDGETVSFQVMEPTAFDCDQVAAGAHPLMLHGPGYSSGRSTGGFSDLRDDGYAVISWDPRGFGDTSGSVRVMDPEFEGEYYIQILDWAEQNLDYLSWRDEASGEFVAAPANRSSVAGGVNLVVGAQGGSYGGGYQLMILAGDEKMRLDAIAPDITWHDLRYALNPGDVIKTAWDLALSAVGESSGHSSMGSPENDGQDPFIKETLARASATNDWPAESLDWFHYRGLGYWCAAAGLPAMPYPAYGPDPVPMVDATGTYNVPARAADGRPGFGDYLVRPNGVATHFQGLDVLLTQGLQDGLFNFNEAWWNQQCLRAAGADVSLLTHSGGHRLAGAEAPDSLPNHSGSCPSNEDAWFNARLKPNGGSEDYGDVCFVMGNGDVAEFNSDEVLAPQPMRFADPNAVPGFTTFSVANDVPVPNGYTAIAQGSGNAPVSISLGVAQTGGIIAGIPRVSLTVSSLSGANELAQDCSSPSLPTATGCDSITFVGLGIRRAGTQFPPTFELMDDQLTPIRGLGLHEVDLVGVAERLQTGDEVALLLYGSHTQFATSFSRDTTLPAVNVSGTVKLPLFGSDAQGKPDLATAGAVFGN